MNIEKMAARRVTATTVDWAKFAEKIPAAQKPAFNALKNKTDAHIRKLAALPESLPKIDFANYKAKIAVAGEQIFNNLIHFMKCVYRWFSYCAYLTMTRYESPFAQEEV